MDFIGGLFQCLAVLLILLRTVFGCDKGQYYEPNKGCKSCDKLCAIPYKAEDCVYYCGRKPDNNQVDVIQVPAPSAQAEPSKLPAIDWTEIIVPIAGIVAVGVFIVLFVKKRHEIIKYITGRLGPVNQIRDVEMPEEIFPLQQMDPNILGRPLEELHEVAVQIEDDNGEIESDQEDRGQLVNERPREQVQNNAEQEGESEGAVGGNKIEPSAHGDSADSKETLETRGDGNYDSGSLASVHSCTTQAAQAEDNTNCELDCGLCPTRDSIKEKAQKIILSDSEEDKSSERPKTNVKINQTTANQVDRSQRNCHGGARPKEPRYPLQDCDRRQPKPKVSRVELQRSGDGRRNTFYRDTNADVTIQPEPGAKLKGASSQPVSGQDLTENFHIGDPTNQEPYLNRHMLNLHETLDEGAVSTSGVVHQHEDVNGTYGGRVHQTPRAANTRLLQGSQFPENVNARYQ